jgi:hypothetical protein
VVSVVLAHHVVSAGGAVLPSRHGFTLALLISVGAAAVALLLALAIPRPQRVPARPVVDEVANAA